ncbi:MAG: prepilin-type N-terminal cleavage/methylation domain-containing protein [Kiritimatiellae bacterium]|nr:prepilin-type N-terminal cleavage/methylation domain-containing protein [Kiritimatiellia bacterium]
MRPASGFTLIELLMVVVLALLSLSLAIPAFSAASRSNRLRTAARTIVAAHRYARGMAVLQQADMVLLLDERSGRIQVVRVQSSDASTNTDAEALSPSNSGAHREAAFYLSGAAASSLSTPTNALAAELDRYLPDGIRLSRVDADPLQRHETTWWVDYLPNGMCDPFAVELSDDRGHRATIEVNGLTGRAQIVEGPR